jgi:hypothetical protein
LIHRLSSYVWVQQEVHTGNWERTLTEDSVARREEERQDAEHQAYEISRRAQALDLFASLPDTQRAAIEAQAVAHAAKFSGSLRTSMIEFGKVRFTIERHGDKLSTFEQWKAERWTIS